MPIHWDEVEIAEGIYAHAELTDDELMDAMVRAIAKMCEGNKDDKK